MRRDRVRHFIEILPSFMLKVYTFTFFVFLISPIVIVVLVSFGNKNYVTFPIESFSLRWFYRAIEYPPFRDSLFRSAQIAIGSAVISVLIGVPAALVLTASRSSVSRIIIGFLISPLAIPGLVLGFALLFYLSAVGIHLSLLSLLIAHSVVSIPYIVRTVAGVYKNRDESIEEAAILLGADWMRVFYYITLPTIRPAIFAGCMFAILISLDNLPVSFFFSGVNTNLLPVVVLSYLENQFDPAVAALCTIQLIIAVIILVAMEYTVGLRKMISSL